VDPAGFRLSSDVRAEAAAGTFDYVRGAADATLSRPLGSRLAAALTFGAGTSGGALPPQRQWYLGSSSTVRGQRARPEDGGDAYWLGRAELGLNRTGFRPSLFYDVGWTGDRRDFGSPGQPLSGFGVGASVLDGVLRFDIAKGVAPNRSVRGYLYLDARF
jgi:hemolysin activation/secretion protein